MDKNRSSNLVGKLRNWIGARGAIAISEEDGVRQLHIGGDAIQSAMRLDDPERLELDYVRAMMAFLLFVPRPRDVLMIGLGGGSMAKFIHRRMPEARVTVAEINPGVVTVARRYFDFPPEDARLEVIIGDGADVVMRRPRSCDVLVVDGFVGGRPAPSLCTEAFYGAAFAALRPSGAMVANFMSDDRWLDRRLARIERIFGRAPLLLLAEEKDNLIAFAVRGGPARITWKELARRAREAKERLGLALEEFFAPLRERNPHDASALLLSADLPGSPSGRAPQNRRSCDLRSPRKQTGRRGTSASPGSPSSRERGRFS